MGAEVKETVVAETPVTQTAPKYEYTPKLNYKVAPITPVDASKPVALGKL